MNRLRKVMLATALALAVPTAMTVPAVAQSVSQAVGNALKDAQRATNMGAAQAAIARGKAAAANDTERRAVGQMAASVYTRLGAYSQAASELQAIGGSPAQLAQLFYQAGNYSRAIELARRAGGSGQMGLLIAQSHLKMNNLPEAASAYERLAKAGGAKAGDYWGQLAAIRFRQKDTPGYIAALEQLIRIDPSPRNWRTLLLNLRNQPMPDPAKLSLFLLMQETGNLTGTEDIADMAKLAMVTGAPGLAVSGLQAAISGGNADPSLASLLNTARSRSATANTDLARLSASRVGADVLRAARTQLGNGQNAQAAALFQRAIATPGADVNDAQLGLGIALLRQGNANGARTAFAAAKDRYTDIAQLWRLYSGVRGTVQAQVSAAPKAK
jgi:tetratricopeptide (TPR) repeat protein